MTYSNDWTITDNPADHSKFKDQPSHVRKLRTDIEERLADILYGFTSGETTVGIKQLLMGNQTSDPSAPTDGIVIFAKDSYVFTVSGVTTVPVPGATYTNNAITFTVLYASATQLYCSGSGAPAASGDLTKASGTGDATIAFSASSSKSEIHVRHESAGVKVLTSLGKLIAGALTSLATIASDAGIIPIANLASGTPDGTKYIRDDGTLQTPPNDKIAGDVVQVVNYQTGERASGSTVMPYDDTIPKNTEGDLYMSLSITPKSSTNKLKIEVVTHFCNPSAIPIVALFHTVGGVEQAAALAAAAHDLPSSGYLIQQTFTHYMTAGEAVEKIFKVRCGAAAGTNYFNGSSVTRWFGGVLPSSITITEIKV